MGDSGGPLVLFRSDVPLDQHYVQVAVVAGGVGRCGDSDFPGVYVRMEDPDVLRFVYETSGVAKEYEQPPDFSGVDGTIQDYGRLSRNDKLKVR